LKFTVPNIRFLSKLRFSSIRHRRFWRYQKCNQNP